MPTAVPSASPTTWQAIAFYTITPHFFVTIDLHTLGNLKLAQVLARHKNTAAAHHCAYLSDDHNA